VRPRDKEEAHRFVSPVAKRLRALLDEPPFGRAAARDASGDARIDAGIAPRSVFVFHKSTPFKGHRTPVRHRTSLVAHRHKYRPFA